MPSWVIQIDGYDPVAAAAVTLRASSEDDDRICHLDGQVWWPAIARLPILSYDFFGGDFDANRIQTPSGAVVLSTDPFPLIARYALGGARFRLWGGNAGDSFASWTLRFDGVVVAQPAIADGLARIDFKVDDRWLDAPLLDTFDGTGDAEGPAELTGSPKPLMLGAPRFAGGTMINVADSIIQLSSYGTIQDVDVAFEALGRFGASSGNYASYAALAAATLAPGQWATCKATGMVRLGAPPAGRLSFHVQGDAAGPGGWVRKAGAIINRIGLLSGGTGKIATSTLTALDTARPWNLSLAVREQVTARELVQRVAASVNAVAGISWTGKLWAQPVGIGSPSITLAADGSALPPVARVEQIGIAAPFWRLAIEAENTWEVHSESEVALADDVTEASTELYDAFDYASANEFESGWVLRHPFAAAYSPRVAEIAIVITSDTGGRAVRVGNNAGNDSLMGAYKSTLPYAPEDLHTLEFNVDIGASAAGAVLALGVACLDGSGANITTDAGTFAYISPTIDQPAATGRRTYRAYFRGTATVGTGNNVGSLTDDMATIRPLPTGTVRIVPMFLASWPDKAGQVTFHEMRLSKLDVSVLPTGAWSSTRTYALNEGVTYGGRFFASRQSTNLNHQPPGTAASDSWWFLISDKGTDGTDGANAKLIYLISDRQTINYNAAGSPAPSGQTTVFTIQPQNLSTSSYRVAATKADGAVINAWSYFNGTGLTNNGDNTFNTTSTSFNITSAQFDAARGATKGIIVTISHADGVSDKISIVMAQDGAGGADGAQGISTRIVFQRSATVPATPSASAGTPSGWYDTTTAVPAGSNPMWSTTGATPLGGGNYTWGDPVRVEAISANQTGQSTGAFYTTSATLSFVLNPGQSRNVYIQGDVPSPTGSGNVYPQIEYREAGGSWSASNGTTWTYAAGDPVPAMDLNHSILVSNSGTEARTYEVRGTIVRSNTNSGAINTALSFLRI